MWDYEIAGVSVYYIISYFIIFSVGGWLWESFWVSIREKRIVNRGFVTGPVCTVYGCGGVAMYLMLRYIEHNLILVFFAGMFIATTIEFITGTVMEAIFHTSWWDYTEQKFNIKGRICLGVSLCWGGASVAEFLLFIPFCNFLIAQYPKNIGEMAYMVFFAIYVVDFTVSSIAAINVAKTIEKMENMLDEFAETLRNSKIYSTGEELFNRLMLIRRNIISADLIKRYSKRIEVVQAVWADRLAQLNIPDGEKDTLSRLHESAGRFEEGFKQTHLKLWENRIFKAYPKLKSKERVREYLQRFKNRQNKK